MIARFAPVHVVAVVAFDGVVPFDLATACEVFGWVRLADGRAPYQVRVCGVSRELRTRVLTIKTELTLAGLRDADTVVLPGVDDLDRPVPPTLVRAVRRAAARGARVASICSGAFLLAATGLLDGKRATTHWLAAPELARRHPAITVDPNVLFVDQGSIATSAGAAAGLDLCLHLVRRDFGSAVAAQTARLAVMPLEREAGQAQFIVPRAVEADSLEPLLRWMQKNLNGELRLPAVAARAGMSTRTLNRHFRDQVGTTPARWVLRARVRHAQQLLEKTRHPIERIAGDAGFGSTAALREQFRRLVGTSPRAYRRAFRSAR